MALDIDALAAQYTTTLDSTVPPVLEDRGDGQATLGALERTQKWALGRWPNPAKLRDGGATLRAIAAAISHIGMARTVRLVRVAAGLSPEPVDPGLTGVFMRDWRD